MVKAFIRTLRPKQWTKNIFIFAALLFDGQLFQFTELKRTLAGFVLLCLISSTVYIINDLADIERDRQHPRKQHRPIASGRLPVSIARIATLILILVTVPLSFFLNQNFGIVIVIYLVQNLLYSFWLKHIPIIDVFVIATGFLLRVAAGIMLISVERFSPWMYVCTTLIALFIGFGKRRAELQLLMANAQNHRKVLEGYSIPLLDQFITIVSASTIISYSLYTFSAVNLPDNHLMMLTIPFVLYGIFRYLYLIQVKEEGGAPDELILTDLPLLITIILFGAAAILILYVI